MTILDPSALAPASQLPVTRFAFHRGPHAIRVRTGPAGPAAVGAAGSVRCEPAQASELRRTLVLLRESELARASLRRERDELLAALDLQRHQNQLREDFAAMAGHELRTPLNALYLQTQLRRRLVNAAVLPLDRQEAMIQRDERLIGNMIRLVDDMSTAVSLNQGHANITALPMDLAATVFRVVESFVPLAHVAGCLLTATTPPTLPGIWDEFRLEQVLGNLLSNAIRYGAGQSIHVTLEACANEARLAVRDGGRGIAAGDRKRIFERFERAGDTATAAGLGLGLFICDQIVQAHGGSIGVESASLQGSLFTVRLPLVARA